MWFITQCFGVGFRGSHRAGDSVPLPGPPDPPDMAPDRQYDTLFPCFPGLFMCGRR